MSDFVFHLVDAEGSGQLNSQQVFEACCVAGADLGPRQVELLCRDAGLVPPLDSTGATRVMSLALEVSKKQGSFDLSVLDPAGSGKIDADRLCGMLEVYGDERLSPEESADFRRLFNMTGMVDRGAAAARLEKFRK